MGPKREAEIEDQDAPSLHSLMEVSPDTPTFSGCWEAAVPSGDRVGLRRAAHCHWGSMFP